LVSAKTVQVSLPVLLAAAIVSAVVQNQPGRIKPSMSPTTVSFGVFLLYALCSSLWSPEPQATALIVLVAIGLALSPVHATNSLVLTVDLSTLMAR
jgi:hypothetical protein